MLIDLTQELIVILLIGFIVLPLIILFVNRKYFNGKLSFWSLFMYNIFIFSIFSILVFYLIEINKDYIFYKCFEPIVNNYQKNAPIDCHSIDISKFYGIGWPVKVFFWICAEIIYSLVFFTLFIQLRSRLRKIIKKDIKG